MPSLIFASNGTITTLEKHLDKNYSQIHAYVPLASQREQLSERAGGLSRLKINPQALTAKAGHKSLKIMNLSAACSFQKPTGINTLYPNLYTQREIEVETSAICEAVEKAKLADEKDNVLILETNGEEKTLLLGLIENKQLTHFKDIYIKVGKKPLYEGAATADELQSLLKEQGYQLQSGADEDPDQPLLKFKLNKLLLENIKLTGLNRQLTKQKEQALKEAQAAKEAQEQLHQQKEQALKELQAVKEAQEQLHQEKEQALKEAQAEKEAQEQLRHQADQLTEENKKLKDENEQLIKRRNQLKKELETSQTEQANSQELEQKLAKKEKQIKTQQEQLAQLQTRSQQLENDNFSLTEKQELISKEHYKAQGQLELLKQLMQTP